MQAQPKFTVTHEQLIAVLGLASKIREAIWVVIFLASSWFNKPDADGWCASAMPAPMCSTCTANALRIDAGTLDSWIEILARHKLLRVEVSYAPATGKGIGHNHDATSQAGRKFWVHEKLVKVIFRYEAFQGPPTWDHTGRRVLENS